MIREYEQSCEKIRVKEDDEWVYYSLVIRMICLDDRTLQYHRWCDVYCNGERIGICKTKKEAKELIRGGYLRRNHN